MIGYETHVLLQLMKHSRTAPMQGTVSMMAFESLSATDLKHQVKAGVGEICSSEIKCFRCHKQMAYK